MPKFNYALEFKPDATVGNLIGALQALIERIQRAEPDQNKLLNNIGAFTEFYNLGEVDRNSK